MNSGTQTTTTDTNGGAALPKVRSIRKKTRHAIHVIATTGKTQGEAAKIAGMNQAALSRALARPEERQLLEQEKQAFALNMDDMKIHAAKLAIAVGVELMNNGNETTKAKMVELFTGGKLKSPTVVVQNNVFSGGYEYAQPGAHVVEIVQPGEDDDNGVPDAETLENKGD